MKKIHVTTAEQLNYLYMQSALTIEGLREDDAQAFIHWVKHHTNMTEETIYIIKGSLMNQVYKLTGDNAYSNDLTIQAIPLDIMENPFTLVDVRFTVGARWFDDIVENNIRREEER